MFELPNLPYSFEALEPNIDAKTMEIHHDKHHEGYVKKLNAAVEGTEFANKDIVEILKKSIVMLLLLDLEVDGPGLLLILKEN